jgi:mannose-6-phosphate isomerase-like protein (cupin superfamily)
MAGTTAERTADRRAGVYLEPSEEATITAGTTPLVLLLVTVPKHTGRPVEGGAPATGYFFEDAQLRSLIDEKGFRERTFWDNKETGLSGSWDLQLGRMLYASHAHSPRHVHHPSKTSTINPEHFYLIEKGTGEVKHDDGSLPVGPGSLVLIPSGEWHQLVASDSGFDYIEFQAPFDFVTTMDHDPLGKNWYIKGTDDGTGKPSSGYKVTTGNQSRGGAQRGAMVCRLSTVRLGFERGPGCSTSTFSESSRSLGWGPGT